MANVPALSLVFLFCFYFEFAHGTYFTDKGRLVTYIVHVDKPEGGLLSHSEDVMRWHQSFLPSSRAASLSSESDLGRQHHPRLVYSYQNAISGFAARLTDEEVESMAEKKGFVSARPQRVLHRLTTHTPTFLGLQHQVGFLKGTNFGKGIIIGMLDSGAFPNHPSFTDEGMSPPPAKWKGKCEFNISSCNNKIIGARTFREGAKANGEILEPPNNDDGHGTHTASTAAGQFVNYADVLGNAKGTAVGIAPRAHLAIYKVCYLDDCPESDMLAGMDAAIADGVDVLSLSIGIDSAPYFQDPIAIGAFAAVQKGIFVSCAAGNSGPFSGVMSNDAPWILTVGASTIDRRISAVAKLSNGEEFDGESLFQPSGFPSNQLPLVYSGNGTSGSAFCGDGSLNDSDVKGKVVLCERGGGIGRIAKGEEVKRAGGSAMILVNDKATGFSLDADAHVLPATHISFSDGQKIKSYINSTRTPTAAMVFKGTIIGNPSSPAVASFSSRGPSVQSPGILKPDIIGPGVSIVAAWPFPVKNITSTSNSYFNMMSGTSMSCPHLSGIAALLKSAHPYWSPAAIKSAIMTTAEVTNLGGKPIVDETLEPADLFSIGAGHVNPSRANEPGLVYDIHPDEYIPYLCGLGYKDEQIRIIAHRKIHCSEISSLSEGELNYPSFSATLGPTQTFKRTVTNVGEADSTYVVIVTPPQGVQISVSPTKLYFTETSQKATYLVTVSKIGSGPQNFGYAQGNLKWVSAKYSVRSPISITFP